MTRPLCEAMRELETLGAGRHYQPFAYELWNNHDPPTCWMLTLSFQCSSPRSPRRAEWVMAFFDRKMNSSYRNGRKAGLLEGAVKRSAALTVSTERA